MGSSNTCSTTVEDSIQCDLIKRQCGPVVRVLALRSGDPRFKTRSDCSLNLILVVPGSTSQLHLWIANWFASGQLGFLTVIVVLFRRFVVFHWPWKAPMGSGKLSMYCIVLYCSEQAFTYWYYLNNFLLGKILNDDQPLSTYKIDEKGFVVVMVTKVNS